MLIICLVCFIGKAAPSAKERSGEITRDWGGKDEVKGLWNNWSNDPTRAAQEGLMATLYFGVFHSKKPPSVVPWRECCYETGWMGLQALEYTEFQSSNSITAQTSECVWSLPSKEWLWSHWRARAPFATSQHSISVGRANQGMDTEHNNVLHF